MMSIDIVSNVPVKGAIYELLNANRKNLSLNQNTFDDGALYILKIRICPNCPTKF